MKPYKYPDWRHVEEKLHQKKIAKETKKAADNATILKSALQATLDHSEQITNWKYSWDENHDCTVVSFHFQDADFCCRFNSRQPENVIVTSATARGGPEIMLQRTLREYFQTTGKRNKVT